jgi:hypothetical protein
MRSIKLDFKEKEQLDKLLEDPILRARLGYAEIERKSDISLIIIDPRDRHFLDTEVEILTDFGVAFKRVFFSNSGHPIEFNNPFVNELKGGIKHNSNMLITSTDILIPSIKK